MWITLTACRYRLDPALTGADLWQFQAALEAARTAGDDQARLAALHQAVACYRGPVADGAGYDWAEPYAETARRRARTPGRASPRSSSPPTPSRRCPRWRPP